MRASANEGESESRAREKNAKKGKRRQADKQMKFINMLLITPDNATDRGGGSASLCHAMCCVCILHTNCQINEQNTTAQ